MHLVGAVTVAAAGDAAASTQRSLETTTTSIDDDENNKQSHQKKQHSLMRAARFFFLCVHFTRFFLIWFFCLDNTDFVRFRHHDHDHHHHHRCLVVQSIASSLYHHRFQQLKLRKNVCRLLFVCKRFISSFDVEIPNKMCDSNVD